MGKGSNGVLTVAGDTKEALTVLKLAFQATTAACPADEATTGAKEAAPAKKKQLFTQDGSRQSKYRSRKVNPWEPPSP